MILKNLLLIVSLLNPVKVIQPNLNNDMKFLVSNSRLVAMAPLGGHISRHATNKMNPPGCSVNTTTTNQPNGSVETRETLICTTVKIESPDGKITKKPKNGSKQNEKDKKQIKKILEKY